MRANTDESDVLSKKLFLIVMGGAIAFLTGIALVMTFMPVS